MTVLALPRDHFAHFSLVEKISAWGICEMEIVTYIMQFCSFGSSRVRRCAPFTFLVPGSLESLASDRFGAVFRISLQVFHAWQNLYVDSAWIGDCYLYHAILFLGILARLEMWHSRVFGLGIVEVLSR